MVGRVYGVAMSTTNSYETSECKPLRRSVLVHAKDVLCTIQVFWHGCRI
jgi:hypothetical protein